MKAPFSKFKAARMSTGNPPAPKMKSPIGKGPRQAVGFAGIRPRKMNNPLKSVLAPDKPYQP